MPQWVLWTELFVRYYADAQRRDDEQASGAPIPARESPRRFSGRRIGLRDLPLWTCLIGALAIREMGHADLPS